MRTQDEIVKRVEDRKKDDFFGFEISTYVDFLDYPHAKPYLKTETTESEWAEACKENKSPRSEMIDYMEFAWEKANNFRGLSAGRSMAHYVAWLWLDGDEIIWPTLEDYNYYGKDKLVEICKYLGIDSEKWDDHVRRNSE